MSKKPKGLRKSVCGAAMYEYIVGMLFIAAALFLPVLPKEGGNGRTSAAVMLTEAIKENYGAFLWAMSIPN